MSMAGPFFNCYGEEIILGVSGKKYGKGYARAPGSGPDGETCGSCKHFVIKDEYSKRFFKCGLMRSTNGAATDIRKSSPACSFWAEPTKEARP